MSKPLSETLYVHDPDHEFGGPLLPAWVIQPLSDAPLDTLRLVESYFLSRYIGYKLYDSWMRLNSGGYQLGSNDALLSLWGDRLLPIQNLTAASQDEALGHAVSRDPASRLLSLAKFAAPGIWLRKCRIHGAYHVKINPKVLTSRRRCKPLNQLFPWLEKDDKQKTNLDFASLAFQALRRGHASALQSVLRLLPATTRNTTPTAFLIAALGNPQWARLSALMERDGACCLTHSATQKYFKAVTTAVRRTARWVDGSLLPVQEVADLAYFELSTGRAVNVTDWEEEKAKRVGPHLKLTDPWSGLNFDIELRKTLDEVAKTLVSANLKWQSWSDFILSRQAWAPAGSAGPQFAEVEGEKTRLNKHSYFESITKAEMVKWLDSTPQLKAVASEKMEPGKSRAIYGTLPVDQTITTYVIRPLEDAMNRLPGIDAGLHGASEIAGIGKRLKEVTDDGVECTMLDYADFNYQHTLSAQHSLYDAIASRIEFLYPGSDQARAARWLAFAQLSQYVKFPGSTEYEKVTQGMFSGVRSTNFTNTLLNWAYYETSKRRLKEEENLEPVHEFRRHQGDDVWISNRSRLWAIRLYNSMATAGFVFQPGKQLFDRARGEFLRVLYTSEGARGYLMRSVATLVVKPVQSIQELAPHARATALNSLIQILYRRGLTREGCETLWWSIIPHALRLPLPEKSGVGIPLRVAMAPCSAGGLDLGPPSTVGLPQSRFPPLPALRTESHALEEAIPSNMSSDWISMVSRQVRQFDATALKSALHAQNVTDSLRSKDRLKALRFYEKELKEWVSKIGAPSRGSQARGELSDEILRSGRALETHLAAGQMRELEMLVDSDVSRGRSDRGILGTIIAAVSASPFKDIASARLALKVKTLEATRACIALCPAEKLSTDASAWFESLIPTLGPEVTANTLGHLTPLGPSYEALLNPIVLSWAIRRATDWAILGAPTYGIKNPHAWARFLEERVRSSIVGFLENGYLASISHY
ncbi:polymerase [Schistocephalus solidus toti-like virus 2]|uniref:RNA-directed RNA polymerase n=1 Tax=Schistocephalus solidus toti-like virus 2 TaxID=2729341 RepID=A0A6M3RSK9_9VIRU|nr:polymerase [Schistocephalus solidus toti-like virus 2]